MPDIDYDDPKYHDATATENRFTGLHPDNTYPEVDGQLDFEQEKRLQARQESARTPRVSSEDPYDPHPPFTERGPDAAPVLGVVNPTAPTYNTSTDVLTIPTEAHVKYYDVTDPDAPILLAAGNSARTEDTDVEARVDAGYRFAEGATTEWSFTI